ncbi:MAG: hypothetical protein V2I67_03495 [Thermoanaerobaculales bacterium]|jgi:hypothetical protein|nr:hypothetical protein [Thermoanaerobaculales bacterium]
MQLEGFTARPRHRVVFEVTENIRASGGFVLDHQEFSNHILRLTVEIASPRPGRLLTGIADAGVDLSESSTGEAPMHRQPQ